MFRVRGANCGCRGECGIICGEGRNEDMSIAVELPPAMEHEAVEYASVRGTTLQQMFLDYLKRELDRTRAEGEIPGRALEESFRESEAMSSGELPKQRFGTVEELFAECAS